MKRALLHFTWMKSQYLTALVQLFAFFTLSSASQCDIFRMCIDFTELKQLDIATLWPFCFFAVQSFPSVSFSSCSTWRSHQMHEGAGYDLRALCSALRCSWDCSQWRTSHRTTVNELHDRLSNISNSHWDGLDQYYFVWCKKLASKNKVVTKSPAEKDFSFWANSACSPECVLVKADCLALRLCRRTITLSKCSCPQNFSSLTCFSTCSGSGDWPISSLLAYPQKWGKILAFLASISKNIYFSFSAAATILNVFRFYCYVICCIPELTSILGTSRKSKIGQESFCCC